MLYSRKTVAGFTLVEIVIAMVVIGILAAIGYSYAVPKYKERTYYTRANSELHSMSNALTLYVAKYNDYPEDADRDIPVGIKEFLQTSGINNEWPDAPWPGSVYDYDRWDDLGVIQISVRFCAAGDDASCQKNFPDESFVTEAWDSYSSIYYCVKGPCRSHQSKPADWPGYCINCGTSPSKFY